MSEPSKELETIKEDESSASASSVSIVEETPATSTTSTAGGKKQANKMASHMIVAGSGAGGGGGLQTPTVGNIIEEEEEEEEETDRKNETTTTTTTETATTEKESKMTEESTAAATTAATTTASSQPANPPAPVTFLSNKFVLETVHLDDQGQPITPVSSATSAVPATPNPTPTTTNNTNESTAAASNTNTLAAGAGGGGEAAAALSSRKSTTSSNGDEEQVEIKVEEGYATRQMDEYFRQTIAAIKEELHRKLENKDEAATGGAATQSDHHHHRGKKPLGFDDEDGDDLGGDKVELTAIDAQAKDADYFCSNCRDSFTSRPKNNRAFIYQNLMGKDKLGSSSTPSSKRDKVTPILVLIGSIVNQFIIEGVCFNYATLLEFIQREFQFSSKLIATLPAALLLAFFLLLAPISVFLSKQFGTRRIAVLGTFISTLSLLICSFFSNFVVFVIFYGIFTGVGLSLIYVPSVLAISKWFMRKRLLANSLTQLGACLGAAIYPICSELLLRRYKLFDTLLILAGVQFNCLVGSMLIRDDDHRTSNSPSNIPAGANKISHAYSTSSAAAAAPCCRGAQDAALRRSSKLRATGSSKKSSSSAALLIENEHNNSGSVTSPPAAHPVPGRANRAKIKRGYGSGAYHFHNNYLDASETDSTFSVSTTTAPNYTLKQYWRKFIQTRKSTSNGKKNLFHLIAEEKRKTRTLSKMSLEDGFVITTSNNLLAPNDDSHVIVSRRQKLQQQTNSNHDKNSMNPEVTSISATSRATKFFSRIANSLRSLATHASSSSTQAVAATASSSSAQQHTNAAAATKELTSSEYSATHPVVDSSKQNNTTHVQEVNERSPPATIPLMSVFEGPLTTPPATTATQEVGGGSTTNPTGNDSPPLSDGDEDSIGGGEDVMQDEDELDEDEMDDTGVDEEGGASMDGGEDDDEDEDDEDSAESASARVHRHSSQISAALKNQRYLTYRASLANSVRGSLMECSVPEEKEKRRKSAGGGSEHGEDEAQPKEDDTGGESNLDDTQSVIEQRRRARKVRTSSFVAARQQQNKLTTPTPINSTAYTTHVNALSGGASGPTKTNRVNIQPRENQETVGYAKPTIHNLRRFISTMETGSFYNVPLNLEPIEYNLKNSLTKCFAENYRRQHKNMRKSVYQKKYNLILYLDYLSYLTSFKLFLNPILFVLNASFFFHSAALASVLVHVSEFAVRRTLTSEKPITREQSIQVLGLLGLACGLGRLVSTVAYKVNASNVKSRIFAYVLTVLLAAIVILSSTLLCDTYFSFCMFAITFGVLTGFNLNLRTVMIYDMMALEWSDDSLFCFTLFSQAIGIFIGLPIASLLYDIFKDETFVFYYAGALFILSAIFLMPGRKIRSYSYSSYKSLNKFYLQRRFN